MRILLNPACAVGMRNQGQMNMESAMNSKVMGWLAAGLIAGPAASFAAPINQVAYGSLTGTQTVTFDDVAGGGAPGTNYDGIMVSGGVSFGERFAGQTNTPSGDFDVLGGTPTASLSVVTGSANQNLNVFVNNGTQVLTGLGPRGFPSFDAIGEGSIALLFTSDQSQFGFQLVGGNAGTATLGFYRRDGSLIDQIILAGLGDAYYGFSREGGVFDIAGVSIFNNDLAGIGFDNLKFDVPSGTVPEPGTLALLGLGLAGFGLIRRRKT